MRVVIHTNSTFTVYLHVVNQLGKRRINVDILCYKIKGLSQTLLDTDVKIKIILQKLGWIRKLNVFFALFQKIMNFILAIRSLEFQIVIFLSFRLLEK